MSRYLVGIDNGSQSSKVSVFDERGTPAAAGRRALRPLHTPRPGVVEHPDDDLWSSVAAASREAMGHFSGDPSDIVGIGLCTIRFCRVVLRADGSLAQPVLSWMDDRVSAPYVDDDPDVAWVTTSSGLLNHRLTGELTDAAANYQGIWPMDPRTGQWLGDGPEFDRAGIRREMLFRTVPPGQVLGTVTAAAAEATGLPAGLPVVATANDKAVEALGSGLLASDTLLVSLGTYIAAMTAGAQWREDGDAFWTNVASTPGSYLYESQGIRRGMWTVSWFRDLLGDDAAEAARAAGTSLEEELNRGAADVPAGSDGLMTVLDWLAPAPAPYRRGAVLGFDARHGRFHVYRSILEGIALSMRSRARAMIDELGVQPGEVVVSGGGAGSETMMQIMADVIGLPAVRNQVTDAAGLGAAICAAVGLGVHPGFAEAVATMVHPRDRFEPVAENRDLYARIAPVYDDITAHTDEVFRRSSQIFG